MTKCCLFGGDGSSKQLAEDEEEEVAKATIKNMLTSQLTQTQAKGRMIFLHCMHIKHISSSH